MCFFLKKNHTYHDPLINMCGQALSALRTTISILEDSIRGLRQDDKRNVAAGEKKTATLAPAKRAAFDDLVASVNKSVREAVGHAPGGMEAATQRKLLDRELQRERMTGRMGSPRDTIKAFVNSMLNKDAKAGLHDQEQSMTKIAESVKPIVDRFDAVLVSARPPRCLSVQHHLLPRHSC